MRAIVRRPSRSFKAAINDWYKRERAEDASIDVDRALSQHATYVAALRRNGCDVIALEPDERFPDGCFVQDPVVVHGHDAMVLRMKAPTRRGEAEAFRDVLARHGCRIAEMPHGYCDGGDVMVMDDIRTVAVGLSRRTDDDGYAAVKEFYEAVGYRAFAVPVRDCLHLVTGATYLKDRVVLGCGLIDPKPFESRGFTYVSLPPEENYAANVVVVGDAVIMPEGFPRTEKILREFGFSIITNPMSEFAKADGGVTCLSKVF